MENASEAGRGFCRSSYFSLGVRDLTGKFYQRCTKFYPTCSTVASLDFPGKFLPQPVDFASCRGLTGS